MSAVPICTARRSPGSPVGIRPTAASIGLPPRAPSSFSEARCRIQFHEKSRFQASCNAGVSVFLQYPEVCKPWSSVYRHSGLGGDAIGLGFISIWATKAVKQGGTKPCGSQKRCLKSLCTSRLPGPRDGVSAGKPVIKVTMVTLQVLQATLVTGSGSVASERMLRVVFLRA